MSQFSYSSREFDTILQEAERAIRRDHPDKWSDFSASNAGMILLEVLAYVYSVQSWNIDRVANEGFISTAEQPESMFRSVDAHGYRPRGIVPATILADAELEEPLEGSEPAVIRKGSRIKSQQDLLFEAVEDTEILPGEVHPRVVIATQDTATPTGTQIRFLAGETRLRFTNVIARHPASVVSGVWVRAVSGLDTNWYRVINVDNDRRVLALDREWHASYTKSFMIRTRPNDTVESDIVLASVPSGEFQGSATARLEGTEITISRELPNEISGGQYFRFNDPECEYNNFYRIVSVSADRKSLIIDSPYGPKTENGFDRDPGEFIIEQRGIPLVQGQTRSEEFVSDDTPNQILDLTSDNIVRGSIKIFDEDGCGRLEESPWNQITNLSDAGGERFRSYSVIPHANNRYSLEFGNGVFGKIPEGTVRVEYMVSQGSRGNVLPHSFDGDMTAYQGSETVKIQVSNPISRGSGGSNSESIEELRRNLPAFQSVNRRAVTARDFVDMVMVQYLQEDNVAGSVKAAFVNRVMSETLLGKNEIYISCWTTEGWKPEGSLRTSEAPYERVAPIQSVLQNSLQEFLEEFSMVTDQPWVVPGEVDRAIIEVDVKFDSQLSRREVRNKIEEAINSVFLEDEVINRGPVFVTNVQRAIKSIEGHKVTRLRSMYLDLRGTQNPSMETDTPRFLRGVYDLRPKKLDSIVAPAQIDIRIWNKDTGVVVKLDFDSLYKTSSESSELAENAIRRTLHNYFHELRPGEGVLAENLEKLLETTLVHKILELPPADLAVEQEDLNRSVYDPVVLDFPSGGGVGASAEIEIVEGVIQSITINDGGSGYLGGGAGTFNLPISGGGENATGAQATAFVTNGSVTDVEVIDGGSGYTEVDSVEIDGLNVSNGTRILLFGMPNSAQNGLYEAEFSNIENPEDAVLILRRASDADDHLKFHPGVWIRILGGTNQGKIYLYTEKSHNHETFNQESIVLEETTSPQQDAVPHLLAVDDPQITFRTEISDPGDREKIGEPGVMYFMENLEFKG